MEKKLNILLVCNLGMSTGVMVDKMRKVASSSQRLAEVAVEVDAYPESMLNEHIDHYDVVLLGPQIRHKLDTLKSICDEHNTPIEVIETKSYGMADGGAILKQAIVLFVKNGGEL